MGRFEATLRDQSRALNNVDKVLEAAGMGSRDKILTKTREILSSEGIAGIRKAVKEGALPVIVLSALGTQVGGGQENAFGPN